MTAQSRFDVWAPAARTVVLLADGARYPLTRRPDDVAPGWWGLSDLPDALTADAIDYGYLLDGADQPLPDPRSRWQPDGVHGLSRTYDHTTYAWGDGAWTGRQLAGSVIYELHLGTFTSEGTLDAAIGKLDHLAALGVDLVELMPVNAFNGARNWGYDGVDLFAVQDGYGGPAGYQRFVDACHSHGLGVVQDVVYNHLGPSGNYLPQFGPYLSQDNGNTWGSTVNLDGEGSDEVRRFIIDNALMWLCDYHVDALRLDAVHALVDMTALHLLEELAIEVDAMSAHLRRPLTLIAESDLNDPRVITTREAGGYGLDAQWSDDFHHALIANLTGEVSGYYADFGHLESLAKVVQTGFYHDGTLSSFRGRRHGRRLDTPRTPCWRLVICSDNHDQIGNRADGARLRRRIDQRRLEIAAVLTLLSPGTPMIFQGEEWGASTPFVFFTSHPEPELAEATRQGRLEEFAKMDWNTDAVPDPQDPASFTASRLDWSEPGSGAYAELLRLYTDLIRLRRTWPEFTDPRFDWTSADFDEEERWFVMTRGDLAVAVNFGAGPVTAPVPDALDAVLVADGVRLHPDTDAEGSRVDLPGHGWAVIRLAPVTAPPAIA